MKKRVVAMLNTEELPKVTSAQVKKLNSQCIIVIAFHPPNTLILDTRCSDEETGKEIDAWALSIT